MSEERMFILKMIEDGKITAEEGAALLEALRDETFGPPGDREKASEEPPADSAAAPGGGDAGDTASASENASRDEGPRPREAAESSGGEPRRPRPADVAAQIKEVVQSALKGVPQVTDELKDNWKEVAEDVRHSFNELREEIRKKGLVDVSGLMELIWHVRDMGFGHTHEFEDEIEGVLTDENPSVELSTANGAITVRGWEKDRYRLVLRKRLQSADEERAKEIAEEIVDLSTSEGELRAVARHFRNTSVSMELWLPKESRASIDVRSENGAIRLDDVSCREASVATTNGAINVSRVSADRVSTRTTNGKIACSNIRTERAEAKTTNGSVSWGGVAQSGEVRTVNGMARLEPQPPGRQGEAAHNSEQISAYDVSTVNGSVHVGLPDDPETGVSVVAHGRSVRVEGDDSRLSFDGSERGERRGATPDFETAAKKIQLNLRTVNGSIRLNAKGKSAPADEGGKPDPKRADSNPENA